MTEKHSTDKDKLFAYRDATQRPASVKILTNEQKQKQEACESLSEHTKRVFIRTVRDQYTG
jgi:adenylate kinase